MPNQEYPKSAQEVVGTLTEVFRGQNRSDIVEVLINATSRFQTQGYDGWNGGTTYWSLQLEVPVAGYIKIEPKLEAIEKEIFARAEFLNRLFSYDKLDAVIITPLSKAIPIVGQRTAPPEAEIQRLWPENYFRLFLSHVSKYAAKVSSLKDSLKVYGIAAFVAHEDVEPSLQWQNEIELALNSMYALAALITDDFTASLWTDQEVGWALGRGRLVIPVRLGANPYGFAGKIQGMKGDFGDPRSMARSICEILLKNPQTHLEMQKSLIWGFRHAGTFATAIEFSKQIIQFANITDAEKRLLWDACKHNPQVSGAFNVPEAIYGKIGEPPPVAEDESPF
jgi:hypothetical protein